MEKEIMENTLLVAGKLRALSPDERDELTAILLKIKNEYFDTTNENVAENHRCERCICESGKMKYLRIDDLGERQKKVFLKFLERRRNEARKEQPPVGYCSKSEYDEFINYITELVVKVARTEI